MEKSCVDNGHMYHMLPFIIIYMKKLFDSDWLKEQRNYVLIPCKNV